MKLLILGGTSFVGRAIVEAARRDGHDVTIFNRGLSGPELFPEVPRLVGDRDSGAYEALAGLSWDAVVDVSAYVPRHVQEVADVLGDNTGRYLLISTGSVYGWAAGRPGMERLPPEYATEEITAATYGPLKVACEDAASARYGERATIVRPGVVAGPHDPTDRFTYWVRRAARGGRVALAGAPDAPVQVVDSRDLARLVVTLISDDRPGSFDAVGPAEPVTMAEMIQICARAAGREAEVVTVPLEGAEPGLPFVPAFPLALAHPDFYWLFRLSSAAARAAGMPSTPLSTTAADVLAWDQDRGEPPLHAGPTPERESELLEAADRATAQKPGT
ncbi:nucleoside-diphosphate-sugar epimerase [Streptomyces aurantiacus]|uniref:NAD-dependent epimerase/dehydratase family protein n=1 Tax=Streptomyces aurantiacus TaxID=47760 RepID=UPI002791746D|nr:NAD-dependent epimerase/dehydratase family protein [Streptomyces aurantiacus]MDQ0775013.1 nucleoside-diphosphate-sugar epimerase [Streptomyces aurantiacus]